MSETKYLSDGRKVSVIGKINQTEYIVQEIFITDNGDEIPSGENFTAKSLHDTPVKSWKEKEEERLNESKFKLENQIKVLKNKISTYENEIKAYADLMKRNNYLEKTLPDFDWDLFCDVLSGNIKYLVNLEYGIKITEFKDGYYVWDNYYGYKKYKGLRGLSITSHGYDYSPEFQMGNCKEDSYGSKYIMCRNKEEVKDTLTKHFNKLLQEDKVTLSIIDAVNGWIDVDQELINSLVDKERQELLELHNRKVQDSTKYHESRLEELKKYEVKTNG